MSKYDPLWKWIKENGTDSFRLTFEEIMMKKYRSILLIIAVLFLLLSTACERKLPDHGGQAPAVAVFQATVVEVNGEMILAEPLEGSAERLSADRIYVANEEGLKLLTGDVIEIQYDGSILESYPAQLGNVYHITLMEEDMAGIYQIFYDEARKTDASYDLETTERIVAGLGENGYVSVDRGNQVNMEGTARVLEFCKMADSRKASELTVIVVVSGDAFITYDLKTEAGDMAVARTYHRLDENGNFQRESKVSYSADFWQYTEEGYLLLEGRYFSEEEFALTLSGGQEHIAIRVLPLDEQCREWNRQYILPVGYRENNLFLSDWSEEDYGELNFYDLFDIFYPRIYEQPVPFTVMEEGEMGTSYQIPENILEQVITAYFDIDREILRSKTVYLPEVSAYEYRPRGIDEAEYPEIPYPEVVSYTENQDGTIALTVNAVYPYENTSRSYSHKTVIRILEDGSFRYVSNEIISPKENLDIWWHSDRLEKEEF